MPRDLAQLQDVHPSLPSVSGAERVAEVVEVLAADVRPVGGPPERPGDTVACQRAAQPVGRWEHVRAVDLAPPPLAQGVLRGLGQRDGPGVAVLRLRKRKVSPLQFGSP